MGHKFIILACASLCLSNANAMEEQFPGDSIERPSSYHVQKLNVKGQYDQFKVKDHDEEIYVGEALDTNGAPIYFGMEKIHSYNNPYWRQYPVAVQEMCRRISTLAKTCQPRGTHLTPRLTMDEAYSVWWLRIFLQSTTLKSQPPKNLIQQCSQKLKRKVGNK